MATEATAERSKMGAKLGLSLVGGFIGVVAIFGGIIAAVIVLLALLGTPLFAIMGGASEIAWLLHPDPAQHFLNRAPRRIHIRDQQAR